MSNINDEMKAAADYTIKATREKFGQELDFSKESVIKLESFLEQAYQSLSSRTKDDKTKASIFRTANAWGSYLGEFMRLKWGGTWVMKGSERILSIKNIDFRPIGFVYQKITNRPEYSVSKYLSEVEEKISPQPINSSQSQTTLENASQPKTQAPVIQSKNTVTIDKKLIFAIVGVGGFLFVLVACVIGFMIFNSRNAEFKSKLNTFLVEAEKLNLMTEQGVSFQEFRNQLVEVKLSYVAIDSWPSSYQDDKVMFDKAIQGWEYTLDVWTIGLNDTTLDYNSIVSLANMSFIEDLAQYAELDRMTAMTMTPKDWIGKLMSLAGAYYEKGKAGVK